MSVVWGSLLPVVVLSGGKVFLHLYEARHLHRYGQLRPSHSNRDIFCWPSRNPEAIAWIDHSYAMSPEFPGGG